MSYDKDPNAKLDYRFDWGGPAPGPWLSSGEVITAHTVVSAPAGLTVDSSDHDDTSVTAWLSGGTPGARYGVTCHIQTNQDRADDRTIYVTIKQR
jgi:hypothetical protein